MRTADFGDDVFGLDARLVGRTALHNLGHIDAFRRRELVLGGDFVGYGVAADTEHRTLHAAEVDEVGHYLLHHIRRHREGIAAVSACLRDDCSVDADQFALLVHQRSARVAGVHGSVGLDERFDLEFAAVVGHAAALGRDDAGGDGALELLAQRGAYCQHPLAQAQVVAVAEGNYRQAVGVDLDQSHVGGGIGADYGGRIYLVVVQGYFDLGGSLHHVVVCDDVAVLADYDAAAAALLLTFLSLGNAEEIAEQRVDVVLLRGFHRYLDEYHRVHCRFRCVGEVGIVGF